MAAFDKILEERKRAREADDSVDQDGLNCARKLRKAVDGDTSSGAKKARPMD